MRLNIVYGGTNKILGFTATCADKYSVTSMDMTEYLLLRRKLFRIFLVHFIQ